MVAARRRWWCARALGLDVAHHPRRGSTTAGRAGNDSKAHGGGPSGLAARRLGVRLIRAVLDQGQALDDAMAHHFASAEVRAMEPRDRGLARLIASTVLRHRGELAFVVGAFLERPLPADRGTLDHILHAAAAQLLFIVMPPHAVINIAVEQVRQDGRARRFDRLANAVLRRVAERGAELLAQAGGPACNVPPWMAERWREVYGERLALDIVTASLAEAPLDITPRAEAATWASRLNGHLLPTGTIRLAAGGMVEDLPGYAEGAWWVQDAAAALPARLLGDVSGLRVADLCAAPGGKTAQLAAAGAHVTAVESSPERMDRLCGNLARLGLSAETVVADVAAWAPPARFDAVLLDVPCTATGTIRRHPDIAHLKRPGDVDRLAGVQARLLDAALELVRPGGTLVYCSCSLEPEEGALQISRLLAARPELFRRPIAAGEAGIEPAWLTADGELRTLPCHSPGAEPGGMDGFFAARLIVAA